MFENGIIADNKESLDRVIERHVYRYTNYTETIIYVQE